jgi:hypothetical protein
VLADYEKDMLRLSHLIDAGIEMSREQAVNLSHAEMVYREAKAEAWDRCPIDPPEVKSGERQWTAARREAWVNAQTAAHRHDRDLAEAIRDSAREAVRARQVQLSALQTLIKAHQAEAEFARTAPQWAA